MLSLSNKPTTKQIGQDFVNRVRESGQHAVSVTPPTYGLDFLDQGMSISSPPATLQCMTSSAEEYGKKFGSSEANKVSHAPREEKNKTGLPNRLKLGIERLSGISMNDVKVHYNSSKPERLQALAYTQGADIHLRSGQERHLPHEAWHVVQQKQGRVSPTKHLNNIAVNDNKNLEREADQQGARAASHAWTSIPPVTQKSSNHSLGVAQRVVQCLTAGDRPFEEGYSLLTQHSKWFTEAEKYEGRLGKYAYAHPKTSIAVRAGLGKMKQTLMKYYKNHYKTKLDDKTILGAFFKDDKGSAGQVGINLDETKMLDVLDNGNLRERMTAFYNGAYYAGYQGDNKPPGTGFKELLHELVFNDDKTTIEVLGLDKEKLAKQIKHFSGSIFSASSWMASIAKIVQPKLFVKDIFALGNMTVQTDAQGAVDLGLSQKNRVPRSKKEQEKRKLTPKDWEEKGAKLSRRELANAFPGHFEDGEEDMDWADEILTEDSLLPWLSGNAYYRIKPDDSWYGKIHDKMRMPVVAGISGTTTRMLSAFQWLNTGTKTVDFRLAILGWMLSSWDHSLYEILRGSHLADVIPSSDIPDEAELIKDVIRMYMTVAPLETKELRNKVAVKKLFPHELIYTQIQESKKESEGKFKNPETLTSSNYGNDDEGTKGTIDRFNAVKTSDNYKGLSKANAIAIGGYTGGMHFLINAVLEGVDYNLFGAARDKAVKLIMRRLLRSPIDDYLADKDVEIPDWAWEPLKADVKLLKAAGTDKTKTDSINARIDKKIETLVDKVYPEMMLHANMAVDGMKNMPSVKNQTVYRGDWESTLKPEFYRYYRPDKVLQNRTFTSYSKQRDTALNDFAVPHAEEENRQAVLLELKLLGKYGKSIKELSEFATEDEVLLIPGSKIKLGKSKIVKVPVKSSTVDVKVIQAEEV
ncbi:MAG: DUF4157 domain-containing protein [Nitrospirae bacterium]|nr:DUF4157 domain-containing protein [Candidatus Manganitrophaceae bacterium]